MPSVRTRTKMAGPIVIAVTQIALGLIVGLGFIFTSLGLAMAGAFGYSLFGALDSAPMFFLCGLVLLGSLLFLGIRTLLRVSRCRRIAKFTERGGGRLSVSALAEKLRREEKDVLKDLGIILSRKYLTDAHMDLERKEFFLGAVQAPDSPPVGDTVLKEVPYRSLFPFYVLGMVILVWATFSLGGTITVGSLLFVAIAAGGGFFLTLYLMGQWVRYEEVPRPVIPPPPVDTGNSDVDVMLEAAKKNLDEIFALRRLLTASKLREPLAHLSNTAQSILSYLQDHPEKVRQSRQFLTYYLPTTLKLLREYHKFIEHDPHLGNINRSMEKIEDMIGTISDAFTRELDNLYLDKAVDISAEIDVMKGMLHREDMEASQPDNPDSPDINLQL